MKNKKGNDYPQVDLPVDYLAWSNVTGKILDAYGHYPCKIKAGVFALCLRGTVRVMINLTEYVIYPHDFVFLIPGSFIEVRETRAETWMAFVGFSSNFMNTLDFRNVAADSLPSLISNPIIPLSDKVYRIYKDVFRLISRTLHTPEIAVTHNMMTVTLNMLVESISGIIAVR